LFVFNQFGDLERCALRPGNVHSADGWHDLLEPVLARYRDKLKRRYFRGDAAFANPEVQQVSLRYRPKLGGAGACVRSEGFQDRLRSAAGDTRLGIVAGTSQIDREGYRGEESVFAFFIFLKPV
jgi:hypothetical protein